MIPRHGFRYVVTVSTLVLGYLTFPYLYQFGDYVRQTQPFSGQKQIQTIFQHTPRELACLRGQPLPDESPSVASVEDGSRHASIPNVVHFIYGLKNPFHHAEAGRFDFLGYLALRSAIVSLKPDAVYLHYTYLAEPPSADPDADPRTNPWIRRLAKDITLVHHAPLPGSKAQYAHLSDTLRLEILLEKGGIYLDIDTLALRPFDELRRAPPPHDVVLGHEGGNRWGLCNAVIAARPNSTFIARWLATYQDADFAHEPWNYRSVLLPKILATDHADEVCALAPDAFFWPTWTWRHIEWMHQELSAEEASLWIGQVVANGGSLFENQVAYHAWNQMAWDRYLKYLTPERIRTRNTRFNILARRFLESDLE